MIYVSSSGARNQTMCKLKDFCDVGKQDTGQDIQKICPGSSAVPHRKLAQRHAWLGWHTLLKKAMLWKLAGQRSGGARALHRGMGGRWGS